MALSSGALATACSAGLNLDGRPFEVATCSTGQAWGFLGVDISDAEGRRMTIAWTKTRRALVSVFEEETRSVTLGHCADIKIEATDEHDRPYAVSGHFTALCDANGHVFEGSYTFDMCR